MHDGTGKIRWLVHHLERVPGQMLEAQGAGRGRYHRRPCSQSLEDLQASTAGRQQGRGGDSGMTYELADLGHVCMDLDRPASQSAHLAGGASADDLEPSLWLLGHDKRP